MHRKLNIPVDLILRVCQDRRSLELLAFRVYLMLYYKNATLFKVDEEKVMGFLKCDAPTAKRLLNDAKNSSWFRYNERRNSLCATSLKSQVIRVASNNMEYRSDLCYRMDREFLPLNEMVRRLRGIVIMLIIIQASREPSERPSEISGCAIMIRQATFANYLGLSCKSVCLLLKHLADIGFIHKTTQYRKEIKELRNFAADDERIRKYNEEHQCNLAPYKHSRYYCRMKSVDVRWYQCWSLGYSVDDCFSKKFRSIMWTHRSRTKKKVTQEKKDSRTLISIDEMRELIFHSDYSIEYIHAHYRTF